MKKVLLKFFGENNLGDDLFAYIILKRYKNDFYAYYTKYDALKDFDNIHFKSNFFKRVLNKIVKELFNIHNFCEVQDKKKYDLMIEIGGSIFIESTKKHWLGRGRQYNKNYIPYYILGCNFGPYKTEDFLNLIKKNIFSNAEDICFRDKYSYNLFKDLKNIRYAQDVVFTLDTSYIKAKNSKKAIISVIDVDRKVKNGLKYKYEEKISDLTNFLDKKNYEITFMSFCKKEGDELAIDSILQKLDKSLREKVNVYKYSDNIEEALNIIADSQIVVGSRFHANILGLVFGKTIIPIAYSDKTINSLKDINFKGKIFDIRNIENLYANELTDEDLNYKLDITNIRENAKKQFEKLDKVLNLR